MDQDFITGLSTQLTELREQGLYKEERVITSPQDPEIVSGGNSVLNFCANNYLGLSNHPAVTQAATEAIQKYGFGMSSVRFICGTQDIHKTLEAELSSFLKTEDTILYSSCFDANTGLFETILGPDDAIISDQLNHASIIDGVRLCKAKRFRYNNNDMTDLEGCLKEAEGCKTKLIATDGVFSMDGIIANLQGVCDLAEKYGALVMVDDSHAVGFIGETGAGTPEYCGVQERVDIITGTLGKALGGASGGYTSGKKEIIDWLRQRSRPYLFSNSLAPVIASTSVAVLNLLKSEGALIKQVHENSKLFRSEMTKLGFTLAGADHPIIPVMIGDAALASRMADALLEEGIYVIGFSFPVVPKDQARIRTQMSAAHSEDEVRRAISAFEKVGKAMGII